MARHKPPKHEGIEIKCSHGYLVEIDALEPNPKNPNKHPPKQIKLLAKILQAQGWRAPITVSNLSGLVVRGHGRLEAAKLLGEKTVPVDRQDYKNKAEEWADLVADNTLAELSTVDDTLLAKILEEIREEMPDFDFELTGLDEMSRKLRSASADLLKKDLEDEEEVKPDKKTAEQMSEMVSKRLAQIEKRKPGTLAKAKAIIIPTQPGGQQFVLLDPNTKDTIAELRRYQEQGVKSPLEALLKSVFPMAKETTK